METFALIAIVGTVILVAWLGYSWFRQPHPEETAGHGAADEADEADEGRVADYPPGSRPGGPGSEGMNVPEPGEISPGPPERPRDV
jgi:hypothetical protein